MTVEIRALTPELEHEYKELLEVAPSAMFNHSLQYRDFLRQVLSGATDRYLLAYEDSELVAALPLFVTRGPFGVVVNSLPFYGSHGGVVAKSGSSATATQVLLDAFTDFCFSENAICSTLIESPIDPRRDIYDHQQSSFIEQRIGQLTRLPSKADCAAVEGDLWMLLHSKTRNMIRKGMNSGFVVGHDGSLATLKRLHEMHEENMRGVGGIAKPFAVFKAIHEVFEYDVDYRVYTAARDGEIVSAMLVFYFKGMVEYFTPATLEASRSLQPLSLLIFTAMKDGVLERGSSQWNWGGTWLTQAGVYRFKARWGTTDYPYRYHVRVYREDAIAKHTSRVELLNGYPFFFTVPFAVLEGR